MNPEKSLETNVSKFECQKKREEIGREAEMELVFQSTYAGNFHSIAPRGCSDDAKSLMDFGLRQRNLTSK